MAVTYQSGAIHVLLFNLPDESASSTLVLFSWTAFNLLLSFSLASFFLFSFFLFSSPLWNLPSRMQHSRCGFTWAVQRKGNSPPQHHCWYTHNSYTVLLPYFKLVLTCWPLQAPGYFDFQTPSLQRSFKCFIFNYFPFPHIILIAFPVSISYCSLCFLLYSKLSNLGASVIFISLLFTSKWLMIILKATVFTPNH